MYVWTNIYIEMYIRIQLFVRWMSPCVYIYIYIYIYTQMHIYIYIYMYMYTNPN